VPLVIPPGFGEVSVELINIANAHKNYITFGMNVGIDVDPEAIGTALEAFMTDIIQDCSTQILSTGANITVDTGAGYGSFRVNYPGGELTGGIGSAGLSPQVAYLYRKYTTSLGRANRGRFYLPGCVESKVDGGGAVDGTFLTDQRNHAASALAALTSSTPNDYEMLLLHTNSSDVTPVVALYPEPYVATQRRRLVRT
jgi:hypothetical protein